MATPDGLIARPGTPAYEKIDVAGFEFEILFGLSRPTLMVSVAYPPGLASPTARLVARLENLGLDRFNPVVGEQARFHWPD